ncbi:MAG: DUF4129 domain-containing protein [Actinobacteria bacterium]|nr:DUF4129 domain-containing protein [Actinomycetota bacterium]
MAVPLRVLAALTGADPVRPGPEEGRRWAEEELAKPAYGASFLERFLTWLNDLLARFFQPAGPDGPGAVPMPLAFGILALALVLAVLAWVIVRGRRKRTAAPASEQVEDAVLPAAPLPAAEYRRRARQAYDAGDHSGAVVEGFRAIAAQLQERHVLDEARDRTAREFAAAAGTAFPDLVGRVGAAASAFDAARYGGLRVAAQTAQAVLDLDTDLQSATPRPVDPAELPIPLAVPR